MSENSKTIGKTTENKPINIDILKLVRTRLLLQANSGGGKSWALRCLLEQTHGQVQHIVLDLEGEFSTLREKYEYLLVGKEGDIPINLRAAELLAKKILELQISTIIDLSELKQHERQLYVKRFLESMINAPRNLWRPCLVVVDEAHQFCPEHEKSESASAVVDLLTRGRKRGYCGILATQRISKLNKDAVAECNNKLIGRASLDIDMKRASAELGFTTKEDMQSLRDLEAGEFFAFGPALTSTVTKFKTRSILTSHPEIGAKITTMTPPPTSKVKALISKMSDLPQEAEREQKTVQDLKLEIKQLRFELNKNKSDLPIVNNEKIVELKQVINSVTLEKKDIEKKFNSIIKQSELIAKEYKRKLERIVEFVSKETKVMSDVPETPVLTSSVKPVPPVISKLVTVPVLQKKETTDETVALGLCERSILAFLQENRPRSWKKNQIAFVTRYSINGGGFNNALSKLKSLGYIEKNNDIISLLPEGMVVTGINAPRLNDVESWLNSLPKCERSIFKVISENPFVEYSKEDLAGIIGYEASGGGFNNAISRLTSLELIKKSGNIISLNPELEELL